MRAFQAIAFIAVVLTAAIASALLFAPREADILLLDARAARLDDGTDVRVFMKIDNRSGADRLVAASSPVAKAVTLYSPEAASGVPVPADANPTLAPDGAHVVLSGVEGAVSDGRLIPVSLVFEKAGTITTKARFVDAVARGAAGEKGLYGLGDICIVGDGEPAPAISLAVEEADRGWRIEIDAEDFTFAEHLVGTDHIPGVGHGHLYVGGLKVSRVYGPTVELGALPKGTHTIRVTLNTNDHRAYVVNDEPVVADAKIIVQ